MLIVAYPRDETFLARAPFPVSLAPELVEMDRVLDESKLLLAVTNDLAQSAPEALNNGRHATPAEVTLRMSVVRRLMGWSYQTAYREINGSIHWRWFCRIYAQAVPSDSTQQTREALIRPATLQALNRRLVRGAHAAGLTQGRCFRMDGTVIETNMHYPTDSRLLADSARVLGRVLTQARLLLRPRTAAAQRLFRNRARQAKHLARQIGQRVRRTKGRKTPEPRAVRLYRHLLQVVRQVQAQVAEVEGRLRAHSSKRALQLAETLAHYVPLVQRVVAQTTQRVLEDHPVAAGEKLVSLFEPHTAIIQRGKGPPNETEFGRKLWYGEVDGGLISEYRILHGNPPEAAQWVGSLQHHRRLFGHPPDLATADRGVFSPLECSPSPAPRGEKSGAAATRRQESTPTEQRTPAVVQSGAPIPQWDRRPHQRTQTSTPARPLSEPRRGWVGTLGRLGHHHQQSGRPGDDTHSPPSQTKLITTRFPDGN